MAISCVCNTAAGMTPLGHNFPVNCCNLYYTGSEHYLLQLALWWCLLNIADIMFMTHVVAQNM